MKKIIFYKILFLMVISFVFLIIPKSVSAHVLKTDGDIGAVLHIDPDDDPIALSQAGFFFEFKDRTNKFDPKKCDCIVSVYEGGNQIISQSLFQNNPNPNLDSASFFYVFPKKDVYLLKVIGKPVIPNAFQPFTLNFDIRVSRIANTASPTSTNKTISFGNWILEHIIHIVFILAGLGLLSFVIIKQRHQKHG